jgi:O-antigen ligase
VEKKSASTSASPASEGSSTRPSRKKSTPLHPLERALLALAGAHLCFLPWALGGMHGWSQAVSFAFALAGLALALIPRAHRDELADHGRAYRYLPARRLFAFPGFWLGLALLAYATVQALNPSWTYRSFPDGGWTMEPRDHIRWLPTGAVAPFSDANPWRALLVWSAAWLLGCALWIGVTRRAAVRTLLMILALNAAVLALAGILQRLAGNGKILGFIEPSTYYAIATFLYKNHAGAFFNLLLATALALGVWHDRRAKRRLERTSPAPVFFGGALLLATIVALSDSRFAVLLLLGFLGGGLVWGAWSFWRSGRRPSVLAACVFAVALAAMILVGARELQGSRVATRFQELFTSDRVWSIDARQTAARATWEMALDRPLTGWGAGCFRWLFPLYQQRHPAIYTPSWDAEKSFFWEHAHSDPLEFFAELGALGCAPLLGLLGWWLVKIGRARPWRNPPLLLVATGVLLLLVHSSIDFHLQNPAILLTAIALAVLTARWAEIEVRKRASR